MVHVPVLAGAALGWLRIRDDGVYVDGTAGAGGHSALIAERIPRGRLIALDRDPAAVEAARARLREFANVEVRHRNYGERAAVLAERGIEGVDGVLLDAGLSSMQIDDGARGFSFQEEGPLDMRMDPSAGPTAATYLARVDESELSRVLREYGDVGPSRRIAAAIVARRHRNALRTTRDLAAAVEEALDFVRGTPEEVRTVFQAIRMAVNEELTWLERGLHDAVAALRPGGRLVAIAFHSGEDRVVKNVLRDASRPRRELYPDGRVRVVHPPLMRVLTPKPVTPDAEETRANPRAHSARLRAAERV
jgi:16S rRNA (cytosine1402-N4)-methyltransferase